jgi:hypothetical protein
MIAIPAMTAVRPERLGKHKKYRKKYFNSAISQLRVIIIKLDVGRALPEDFGRAQPVIISVTILYRLQEV